MKKYITAVALFIVSIFISITSADASTKLVFKEASNGNVNTSIHFEAGFIGGIDITLKLEGNVKYKSFDLNKNLANKGFVNTSYDENTHSVKIVVVTGGIGTSYNLLNNQKQLDLGKLVVENVANSDTNYSVTCSNLTVLDNSWNSLQITPELENNNLTYTVAKQDDKDNNDDNKGNDNNQNQNQNNNNEQNNNNQNGNITNNNDSNTNNGSTNQQGSNNNSGSNTQGNNSNTNSQDKDDDKDEEDNTTEDDDKEKEDNKDKDTTTNKETDNKTEENQDGDEEKSISKLWFIIPIAIVLVGVAIYFIIKNKKNRPKSDNDFDF